MRLTHRSWTAVRGTSPDEAAATKLITRAATFTDGSRTNWERTNVFLSILFLFKKATKYMALKTNCSLL
uniref:Putative ovule protein n=1 Tax=Solanum chacoense TaxID=4108 RepID=A0A0V0I5S3_SOLCH